MFMFSKKESYIKMKLLWMYVNVLIHVVTDARHFKSVILK